MFSSCLISLLHAGLGKAHICLLQPLKALGVYKHLVLWTKPMPLEAPLSQPPGSLRGTLLYSVHPLSGLYGACEPWRLGRWGQDAECSLWPLPGETAGAGSPSHLPPRGQGVTNTGCCKISSSQAEPRATHFCFYLLKIKTCVPQLKNHS